MSISYSNLVVEDLEPAMRSVFETLINAAQAILHNAEQKREIERLQQENEKLQQENERLGQVHKRILTDNDELEESLIELRKELENENNELKQTLLLRDGHIEDLQITSDNLLKKCEELKNENALHRENIEKLTIERAMYEAMYNDVEKRIKKLREVLSAPPDDCGEKQVNFPEQVTFSEAKSEPEQAHFIEQVSLPAASSAECKTHQNSLGDDSLSQPAVNEKWHNVVLNLNEDILLNNDL